MTDFDKETEKITVAEMLIKRIIVICNINK